MSGNDTSGTGSCQPASASRAAKRTTTARTRNIGCEDAQQCVEHALKAVITAAGGNPKQTHNIPHLIEQAREAGERTPAAVRRTITLTQFAGADRYEFITGGEPPPDTAEYDAALKDARATLEWAEERVRVLAPGIRLDPK